jgi:Ca2+-binding RTX toxin-like protein
MAVLLLNAMDRSDRKARVNRIEGTPADDVLQGTRRRDQIIGFKGDDQLFGRKESDQLRGGKGDDLLKGGGGSDLLRGGRGLDLIRPGKGRNDRIIDLNDGDADLVRFKAGRRQPLRIDGPIDPVDRIVLGGVATGDIRLEALRGDRVGIFSDNGLEAVTRGISVEALTPLVLGSLG